MTIHNDSNIITREYFNEVMGGIVRQLQHRNYYMGGDIDDPILLSDVTEQLSLILGNNWQIKRDYHRWQFWRHHNDDV
jgi:hypothetical protein